MNRSASCCAPAMVMGALLLTTPVSGHATDAQTQAQLDSMKRTIEAQQKEIDELKSLLQQKAGPSAPAQGTVQTTQPKNENVAAQAAPAETKGAVADAVDKSKFEVYGFAQLDYIQDFKRVDQDWDATLRPSKIPTVSGAAGANGQAVLSVRQSRFGVKSSTPLGDDVLQTQFEFDMFGTGDNAGQTTFRLRKAYGSWGDWLAGQTNSVFMDGDSFPNVIDYWGPNGMVFIRNPQLRWGHAWGGHSLAVAIEQPGNDIDPGQIRQIDPELASQITSRERVPDLTAHYRYDSNWGHIQVATVLRDVGYQGLGTPDNRPKGNETGWGVNLSGNIKFGASSQLILAGVHGKGIASYMNDGGTDLAPGGVQGAPIARLVPLTGLVAYFDHGWNDRWTSSIGYSQTMVTNTPFQEGTAFRKGQYASVNLLYSPFKALLVGGEFLWGSLETRNGQSGNDSRLQFSVKYGFSSNP